MSRRRSMEKAILLHTDFMGEEKKIEIKDGKAVIDDKEFIISPES